MNLLSLHPCHLWASLNVCKYLQASFVLFCATSVVQIQLFVNTYFIWLVTYSSYCIVLIRNFEKKLIKYNFEFDIKDNTSNKVRKKCPCKSL